MRRKVQFMPQAIHGVSQFMPQAIHPFIHTNAREPSAPGRFISFRCPSHIP